jgi:DNA-binding LacI/PurR family transcriptional regulator
VNARAKAERHRSGAGAAPTLRDVADAAGVSIATASHAFNRPDRISPTTRERVLATARALDYSGPDPAARALRRGQVAALSLVAPGSTAELWAHPATVLFGEGVATTCDRAGIAMSLVGDVEHASGPTIVFRPQPDQELSTARTVTVDGAVPDAPAIVADTGGAASELLDHLARLGHRHLGVIGWKGERARSNQLKAAWRRYGPAVGVMARGLSRGDGEVAAVAALGRDSAITALVAVYDELALGAINGARRLGLGVPRDVSIVGIDDIPEAELRGLTTAFVPYRPMGELAARVALSGEPAPPPFPAPVALRKTTGRAPNGR